MQRDIIEDLSVWRKKTHRMPLLIRGARQVGKTYVIEHFGAACFDNVVTINFEQQTEYKNCFTTLYPDEILNKIYVLSNQTITPGRTLLFFDEIQACPNAILALRYFYEQKPELHVVAAGSLLEFTLRQADFRMPVGRVQSLYMYPLSFKEYLLAKEEKNLLDYIMKLTLSDKTEQVFHEKLLGLLREYWVLGGMPAVIKTFLRTRSIRECQIVQAAILDGYRSDFGKYATAANILHLQRLFQKAPGLIAQHFRYTRIDPHMQSRDIKRVLADLVDAGLVNTVHATSGSGLPFVSTVNEKKFKLLFLDIGLASKALGTDAETLLEKDLTLINRGNMAEQFVGQELLAYADRYEKTHLYYWVRDKRSSTAEIDFLNHFHQHIYPIEVKAGATGRLRSLQLFLEEKGGEFGVRVSKNPLTYSHRVLSVPFYMLFRLPQILAENPIVMGIS